MAKRGVLVHPPDDRRVAADKQRKKPDVSSSFITEMMHMAEQTFVRETYLADRWGLKDRTLQRWRQDGCGPPYHKIEGRVLYVLEEAIAWEGRQRRIPSGRRGRQDEP
jgi:hypothetical protein